MQATFCGSDSGKTRGQHFNTFNFEMMAHHFCHTLLDYCDPDPTKVCRIFTCHYFVGFIAFLVTLFICLFIARHIICMMNRCVDVVVLDVETCWRCCVLQSNWSWLTVILDASVRLWWKDKNCFACCIFLIFTHIGNIAVWWGKILLSQICNSFLGNLLVKED